MTKPRLILRADGNERIGLGHVMRLLAVARLLGWERKTWFFLRSPADSLVNRLLEFGIKVASIPTNLALIDEPTWLAEQLTTAWPATSDLPVLALDGYHFDACYQHALRAAGWPLLFVDDLRQGYQWADILVNHAGGIEAHDYTSGPTTKLALGPSWALIQPEFQTLPKRSASSAHREQWFLNMGGADPANHTLAVLREVRSRFPNLPLAVVTGAAYPHDRAALLIAGMSLTTMYHDLSAAALAALLAECSGFICPPSGIAYECAAAGGLLFLYPTADNQQGLYDFLAQAGLALPYPELANLPPAAWPDQAKALLGRQQTVFDGRTGERLQAAITELEAAYSLGIRRAILADTRQYFEWVNESPVREQALHSEPIVWSDHERWFTSRLADCDTYLYVLSAPSRLTKLIGQVRVEFDATGSGLIDYSLAPAWRGRGLGTALLRRALGRLRLDRAGAWHLRAVVRETNPASARVFEKLGFERQAPQIISGHRCLAYFANAPAPQ